MCQKLIKFGIKRLVKIVVLFVIMFAFEGFTSAQIIEATSPVYSFDIKKELADKTPPMIQITYPQVKARGFKPIIKDKIVNISGIASDESGIFEVLVNGKEAALQANGNFSAQVLLVVGENAINIKATDGKGNVGNYNFTVIRESETVVVNPTEDLDPNDITGGSGKYYALIIGVNDYQSNEIVDLDQPISDAQKLYNVLTTKYTFEPKNVKFLKNPTRDEIIQAFDYYADNITTEDNILIFYAGHGYWDEKRETGYWIPSDGRKKSTSRWIRNSTIQEYFSDIKTKHTLLIADACFSGGIFKTRRAFEDAPESVNKLYELPSRKAMTSGTLKEVPDKSVFMEYLVKRLNENSEKYLPALDLFSSMRTAILNNSPNTPQYGTVQNAGDEGGDFIFIRK